MKKKENSKMFCFCFCCHFYIPPLSINKLIAYSMSRNSRLLFEG